jgi:hypothetical protein
MLWPAISFTSSTAQPRRPNWYSASGLGEARTEAVRTAGAILRDEGDRFWNGTEWWLDVTDASGQSMLKLHFSADDQGFA